MKRKTWKDFLRKLEQREQLSDSNKVGTARPEKLSSYFQQIQFSGNLLLALLNDLLDVVKLEVGKMAFEWRTADLRGKGAKFIKFIIAPGAVAPGRGQI